MNFTIVDFDWAILTLSHYTCPSSVYWPIETQKIQSLPGPQVRDLLLRPAFNSFKYVLFERLASELMS